MTALEEDGATRLLSLARQSLHQLPDDLHTTVETQRIAVLDLSHNQLPLSLPVLTKMSRFSTLVSIDFTGNGFNELPKEITNLNNLKSLILKHNNIKSLPESFMDLKNLQKLDLSGNKFDSFPHPVLSLCLLSFLHLGGNQLRHIPSNINSLSELIFLFLGGNRLQHIPPEIGDLSKLSALILCGNHLQVLPRELNKLSNLRSLQLHDNQLQTLPPGTVQLKNLEELSLRNNPLVLRFVREWFDSVPSLLELSGRMIKKCGLEYNPAVIPETLCDFLDTCRMCDNQSCEGVYFLHKVRRVKFVDFCGKYRVPLMQYLCSSICEEHDDTASSYGSSSEDETDVVAQHRMRKVLLG